MQDKRIFLYPKDLVILTGRQYNSCVKIYNTIRDSLGKDRKKKITIHEYCQSEGVPEELVKEKLSIQ